MDNSELTDFTAKFPKLADALGEAQRFPLHTFRDYEQILLRIEALWGTLEGHAYLEDLMMTQRPERQDFSDAVATELIRLHLLHIKQYPGRHYNTNDPFAQFA